MRVNMAGVRAICCKHWGRTPKEYEEARKRGEITFQSVIAACRLEMLASPLTAEQMWEWLLPGGRQAVRAKQHQETNNQTVAILKRMKENNGR